MKNSKQDNTSCQELRTRIVELESQIAHLNELMSKVREHKHNYSEDFGLVISTPLRALFMEFIQNQNSFTQEESTKILNLYTNSIELRGTYECLGWPIDAQLKRVKENMIPQIRKNADFFKVIIEKKNEFKDRFLVSKLRMALDETDSLCDRLENIEYFDYGKSEPFDIIAEVKDTFQKDNEAIACQGGISIQYEIYKGGYSAIAINMNQKGFKSYVLGNIIKNLHEHAFKEIDEALNTIKENNIGKKWYIRFIPQFIRDKFFKPVERYEIADIPEKCVRISFNTDEEDFNRINLIIENNGKPFKGNTEDVFKNGIGEGSGIGLYSAKQFLKAHNSSIKMITSENEKYKVGFIINIPKL